MRFAISLLALWGATFTAVGAPEADPADLALVQKVYQSITEAVGDYRRNLPTIQLRNETTSIAAYRNADNKIFIENKALDICKTFGAQTEAALAFLISHELSHFYQKHDWGESGFGTSFVQDQATFNRHKVDEEEADTYGAFITHLAGYNTIQIIPDLLEKLYVAYDLKSRDLSAYPSLAERKQVAEQACAKSQELISVFDVGNYLLASGEYTLAANNYAHVLQYIKCKELYNNLGTANLYATLSIPVQDTKAYQYPVEIDLDIPLRDGSIALRRQLLSSAINNLQTAVNYDNRYYTGFLNLACAQDLSGQSEQATALLNQIDQFTNNPIQKARIAVIRGIIQARQSNQRQALRYFDQAKTYDNAPIVQEWVTANTMIMQSQATDAAVAHQFQMPMLNDAIDGINLLYDRPRSGQSIVIKNESLNRQELFATKLRNSKIYTIKTPAKSVLLQITNSKSERTTEGISIGTDAASVQSAYTNVKSHSMSHRRGYFLVYPEKGLIFNCNRNDQVTEWGVFMKE